MKNIKAVLSLLMVLMLIAFPLTAGAVEEATETTEPYSLTLECLVGGTVPENTVFTFGVTKSFYDQGEIDYEHSEKLADFVIDTATDTSGKKVYPFNDFTVSYCYEFSLKSINNKTYIADPTTVTVYVGEYEGEKTVRTVVHKSESDVSEIEDQPVTATFNCTKAVEVSVSTKDCEAVTKVYDGKKETAITDKNYKLQGVVEGHDVKLSFTKAEFNSTDVKKADKVTVSGLTLTGKDADKYVLKSDTLECKGSITQRPLTVTADTVVITVGQAEPSLTYTLSEELIEGNKVSGALKRDPGDAIGEYAVTIGTLSFGDNYAVTFVDGKFIISNFTYLTVTDKTTSIKVEGYFDAGASVTVTALDPQSEVYAALASGSSWGKIISAYDIKFTAAGVDGNYKLSIPVDSKYEGKSVAVYQQLTNGAISCYKTTVLGGAVTVTTDEVTQFMLVGDKDKAAKEDESSVAMTILKVFIIILAVIIGLALVIGLFFFGMIFFNKTEQLKAIIRFVKRLLRK